MNANSKYMYINPGVLLIIYLAMPLSLLFIVFDKFFRDGSIGRSLPVDHRIFVWFILIFMVPHIFASFFSFADKEYINYYKGKLLRGAQIAVVLGLFIPTLVGTTIIPVA